MGCAWTLWSNGRAAFRREHLPCFCSPWIGYPSSILLPEVFWNLPWHPQTTGLPLSLPAAVSVKCPASFMLSLDWAFKKNLCLPFGFQHSLWLKIGFANGASDPDRRQPEQRKGACLIRFLSWSTEGETECSASFFRARVLGVDRHKRLSDATCSLQQVPAQAPATEYMSTSSHPSRGFLPSLEFSAHSV